MTSVPLTHARTESVTARSTRRPIFDWVFVVAVLLAIGVYIRAIYFTPLEATQGAAQKIYYLHVPSASAAYLAVSITALMSLVYLWLHDHRADLLAESAAEVGLVFLSGVLITGPLWARRIWGTWWTWDARLTLTLFLWFLVAGYLVMRGAIEDDAMRARYSAVLAVLAAIDIPFIHLSVYLFRTLHPMPIVLKPDKPSLPPDMLTTFLLSMGTFALLCVALIAARYRYAALRDAFAAEDNA
jgi:heme exporter protein C